MSKNTITLLYLAISAVIMQPIRAGHPDWKWRALYQSTAVNIVQQGGLFFLTLFSPLGVMLFKRLEWNP